MNIKKIALFSLASLLLASCSSKRDTLSYFQGADFENLSIPVNMTEIEPKIEPFDELLITISSLQPELTVPYNLPLINPASAESGFVMSTAIQQATYFVSPQGDITMPEIGTISVAGLTLKQLEEKIAKLVSKEVHDPVVVARIVNYTINVAGEVLKPDQYKITENRFSILDALSKAGDLTPFGDRQKVILIREENGKREAHELDLTNPEILTSPYFYLKQNDYVYVSPNEVRKDNAKYNQNNAYKLSVISTIVSAASVVASLVIALTIR